MRRASSLIAVCVALLALTLPTAALAVDDCFPGRTTAREILTGQGLLESAIVDAQGRLYYTDTDADALMRLDRPGALPKVVAGGIVSGGGLAWLPGGRALLVGQGDGAAAGVLGNVNPAAQLLRVDTTTGKVTTFARGLSMANGVARGPDGTVYASTDVGASIDRISADGRTVTRNWANVVSGNGLAVDPGGRYLYVNQTFVPAAIQRVDIRHPGTVEEYVRPPATDIAAGLDGMAIDKKGRLYAAANGGGQLWRVTRDRRICALARNVLLPSAVALGRSHHGFSQGHLYAVTFRGVVVEVPLF